MPPSTTFQGFEDPDENAAILLCHASGRAFDQLDKIDGSGSPEKARHRLDKREPITLAAGKAFCLAASRRPARYAIANGCWSRRLATSPRSSPCRSRSRTRQYPDKAVRAALATLAVRANVPDAERLSLLAVHGRRPCRISHRRRAAGPRPDAGARARPAQNNPTPRRTTQTRMRRDTASTPVS